MKSLILCLILLFFSACEPPEKQITKVKVGIDASWYPIDFGTQNPAVNGFIDDVLLGVATLEGIEFEKIAANPNSLFDGLKAQKYDIVISAFPPYSYNMAKFTFSNKILDIGPVLMVPKGISIKTLDALEEKTIGILEGALVENILDTRPSIQVKTYQTIPQLLDAVVSQEIFGGVLDRLAAVAFVSDLYAGTLQIQSPFPKFMALRAISEKGAQEKYIHSFNESLRTLKKEKKLKNLFQRWVQN